MHWQYEYGQENHKNKEIEMKGKNNNTRMDVSSEKLMRLHTK